MIMRLLVLIFMLFALSHAEEDPNDPSALLTQPAHCETIAFNTVCQNKTWEGDKQARHFLPRCHTGRGTGTGTNALPLDDMVGEWITLPPLPTKENKLAKPLFDTEAFMTNNITSPIYGNDLGQGVWALSMYRRLWIPSSCRYHRFTKTSMQHYLKQRISIYHNSTAVHQPAHTHTRPKPNQKVSHQPTKKKTMTNVAFFGDSVLRGIYCGINRIISGDEIFGPSLDHICGGIIPVGKRRRNAPITFSSEGKVFQGVQIPGLFNTTFTYIKYMHNKANVSSAFFNTVTERGSLDTIKMVIDQAAADAATKIDTVVVGSGAWDFHMPEIRAAQKGLGHCIKPYTNATNVCHDGFHTQHEKIRTNDDMVEFIHELSDVCRNHSIQLIYKNNHHNCRFGVNCADDKVHSMLVFPGSKWEVWDTRRVSKQHWRDQTWDGLHFDRQIAHSVKDHLHTWWESFFRFHGAVVNFPHQAELEIQLAQSLLNRIIMPGL